MLACKIILIFFFVSSFFLLGCRPKTGTLTFAVGGASNEIEYWERIIKEFADSTEIELVLLRQPTDTDQRRQKPLENLHQRGIIKQR